MAILLIDVISQEVSTKPVRYAAAIIKKNWGMST